MKHMPAPVSDVHRPLPPFDRPVTAAGTRKNLHGLKALVIALAVGAFAAGCGAGGSSIMPGHGGRGGSNISRALPATSPTPAPASSIGCSGGGNSDGQASCQVKKNPNVPVSKTPASGLTAPQLRSAYGLAPIASGATANGPTVAIVDAFDAPTAEADLAIYRSQFGLPPCTTANGCFSKVVVGGKNIPPGQLKKLADAASLTTWADEIALDLAMASAACPTCKIMLVEAGGQDLDTLADAVNTAASYNPAAISNSWGVVEGGDNTANIDPGAQAAFIHPGIAITASAGDLGVVQFPASSPYVTSVGGTTLTRDASARGWSETAWAQSGAGCSVMFAAPAWQTATGPCSNRAVADVSVIADYNPGVAVYVTTEGGWVVLGGTSAGAPFVAGLYAAANDYGAGTTGAPKLYAGAASLNPVGGATQGSPNGLSAF
jgi:subtilase family serine protease